MTYYEVYKKRNCGSKFGTIAYGGNSTNTFEDDVVMRNKDNNTFVQRVNNAHLSAYDYGIRTVETEAKLAEK